MISESESYQRQFGGCTAVPNGDELRRIAHSVRTSASDDASPTEYVLAGWRAAMLAASTIPQPASVSNDTLYLLRRLLSNQHTLTGPEFRAELEKIVGEAYQQEAQEPVAYVHVPHYTVEGKVRPVVSFEKYQQDYDDGIYSTRIPLYTAPTSPAFVYAGERGSDLEGLLDGYDHGTAFYTAHQPAPAPLTRDQIREVFMAHGFTIKEGQTDLKQYVYDAAYALLGTKPAALSDDTERLEWLLWKLPGDALRYVVGELADTSSGSEFRSAIDAALAAQGGKA